MTEATCYFLTFLPVKGDGISDRAIIHHAVATTEEFGDKSLTGWYRAKFPHLFEEPGHYTVLCPVDRIDIQPKKGKA